MRQRTRRRFTAISAAIWGLLLGGCHSNIVPLKPAVLGTPWAAPPVRTTATTPAPKSPSHLPPSPPQWFANRANGSTQRFFLNATQYHRLWHASVTLLRTMGYRTAWKNYPLGVIVTKPRIGPELLQAWRPDATPFSSLLESTLNTYRRTIRLVLTRGGWPDVFFVTVEVLVQRRENPTEDSASTALTSPFAIGGNLVLVANHSITRANGEYWMTIGRDPWLEKKILRRLAQNLARQTAAH